MLILAGTASFVGSALFSKIRDMCASRLALVEYNSTFLRN